jgi:hypothetical protein
MATYYADNNGKTTASPKRYNPTGEVLRYFYWVPTVALATNDIVILSQIPVDLSITTPAGTDPRATYVLGVHFQIGDIDSGTSLTFSLGDGAGAILSSLTGGRATGPFVVSSFDPAVAETAAASATSGSWGAGVWPRRYTAATDIRMTVTAGVAGLQASPGAIQGYVRYTSAEAF